MQVKKTVLKQRKPMNTTRIIAIGFLSTILIGGLLLMLPISASGERVSPIDALFTAVTSVCVTGLTTVTVAQRFSAFGQVVIACLIQIGGFGIISITSGLWLLLRRRFSLKESILLEDALNLTSLRDLPAFLLRVFQYTLVIEFLCFLCYLPVFLPEYQARGVGIALFHSISAFCNAGIDIIGSASLLSYRSHVWLNLITMLEVVLGGIGFLVYFEFSDRLRARAATPFRLSLHARLVLITTAILILSGGIGFAFFEWNNDATIGGLGIGEKLLASLFQSVTCRTAGFATVPQVGLMPESVALSCFLMFIGGSPISTAGGIKTTTFALILLSTISTLRGRSETTIMKRRISQASVRKAIAVTTVALGVATAASVTLMKIMGPSASGGDSLFEIVSALATVGLTRDLTPSLPVIGKILVMACMYFGRIGPTSLVILLSGKEKPTSVQYAEESVTVG